MHTTGMSQLKIPYDKYEEVFFDVGEVNMFAVMQEYFKVGYKGYIYPEHPRFFNRDSRIPGIRGRKEDIPAAVEQQARSLT